ncbi:MAG: CoA-binding protein [Hyphomicrobiales bacterium]
MGKVGNDVLVNLTRGSLKVPLYLINPHHAEIDGRRCYPDVDALPTVPDLGVIASPAETVPGVVRALGASARPRSCSAPAWTRRRIAGGRGRRGGAGKRPAAARTRFDRRWCRPSGSMPHLPMRTCRRRPCAHLAVGLGHRLYCRVGQ